MTYNGRANEALEHALKKAHEKCAGSLGRYISFDIQNSGIRKVTLEELLEYCNKWYDKEIDKFEDAWKPEIGPHKDSGGRGWQPDRSGIQLLSGHYCGVWGVKVHGRMESVRAMAVIAAGFSLNIPPEAGPWD
ncbi:hypothetical protein Pmar_PMAR023534 [Perkinsus marinus ATCC 50983]|uniref:Uncharacterized protein n=1 Tax=Perkinsus marinus (strain ATCC 50983 / TXsc) TaxID=423536 RepID=C5KCL8_PERM5|nr:hypothetical protein Pmar_PMAR023534 [Perkinsus marinus ATCC 50983]EER17617.1 hypothetical protein Pmar_PMAR023534 [Perkinsus marinus ATCC 50983]|eukprot:XP_002785821.1 hypothetical protein Pmar_PMAR023534 [Perkinsus marinus ATCC 50983]